MSDHERFFEATRNMHIIDLMHNEGCTIEQLYQAFKSRMIAEIEEEVRHTLLDMLGASIDEEGD